MKLSDAMRKGAAMSPQIFGQLTDMLGPGLGTCALGAALVGVDAEYEYESGADAILVAQWPILDSVGMSCPAKECYELICCCGHSSCEIKPSLTTVIVHLNDGHRWSREKIAGWLDEFGLCTTDVEAPAEVASHVVEQP